MKQIQIFCDFDGTITATDNIASIMKHFVPVQATPIIEKVLNKELAIKDGVSQMFALLPSSKKTDIIQYLQESAVIRDGFTQFMEYVRELNIPFHIVSGGIDFFVEPMLEPFGPYSSIYCNSSSFEEDHVKILYPHHCDELCNNYVTQACGCCKPTIIRKHAKCDDFIIVIGDSVTDFEAAKTADLVIARDRLVDNCKDNNIAYKPFNTFFDCIKIIDLLREERLS